MVRAVERKFDLVRPDPSAGLRCVRSGPFFRKRFYFVGVGCVPARLSRASVAILSEQQAVRPVAVAYTDQRVWWWFENRWYRAAPSCDSTDVAALARAR